MLCNSPYHSSVFFFLSPRKSRKPESFFAGEMCEPEEDHSCPFPPRHQHHNHHQQLMDLDDLDLASSWPFDQLTFGSSDPTSPLIIPSSTDQPYSPLWTFSEDEKLAATAGHNICLTCAATNSATENPKDDDDDNNRKLSSPFLEMMPMENQDGYCVIKERMTQALRYFKESTEQQVLAQVWVPVKNRGRYVLTTLGQPFVLDPHSNGLHEYRTVSLMYTFSVDGESDVDLGLPGRVFRQKLPEWTPNVQYYSSKEYSRLDHALLYNVRGTLALPVFEPSGPSCVAVIELILTSQKINYAPEVDKVCKALEAVNLKSSKILDHPNTQICNESRQHALAEILEILTVVCETHKLPLAQTWIPCRHRSVLAHGGGLKKSCSSFDGSCVGQVCMSTTDVAFYVVDAHMWGFREACAEHHLQKGQGVAGKAFLSRNACFCADITQFCKTEYPLVHYARMFGLTGCFAICLQSRHTGDDEYVLEFFLPPIITNHDEQKVLLGEILATMKQHYGSLKVASGVEANEGSIEIIQASADDRIDPRLESHPVPTSLKSAPGSNASLNGQAAVDLDLVKEVDVTDASGSQNPVCLPENKEIKKPTERKRGKTEKSISLEVLQQYFSGSLKDAAKSLGVCPTTMKRICRQHGISRWPSRKINKVNRSLNKLKRVIESVHGTEGAFGLPSLGTSSLPVAVSSIAWQSNLNGSHQQTSPTSKHSDPLGDKLGSSPHQMPGSEQALVGNQSPEGRTSSQEELSPHQNGFSQAKGSNSSRTGSGSREGSAGTPTSRVSRHDSPTAESASTKGPPGSSINPQFFNTGSSSHLAFHHHHHPTGEEPILSSPFSIPDSLWRIDGSSQDPFSAMLVEDAGSSKDLRNLCPTAADAMDAMAVFTQTTPRTTSSPETRSLTIKATYREDIIRFRISSNCSIVDLKQEVAKRLKLEVGTFDIKYLDDDNEWVLIACDADLLECLDISGSSGCSIIRLAIHDTMTNLGSSCESTGEL